MKVVSFISGPGAGKSTAAAGLFYKMKVNGHKVEQAPEYAKDLVFEGRNNTLTNQVYVFGHQHHRIERLRNQVDWVITDSPLILSIMYMPKTYPASFKQLVIDMWNMDDNYLFFINRKQPYQEYGRRHSFEEAKAIDNDIKMFLKENNIRFKEVNGDESAIGLIYEDLFSY